MVQKQCDGRGATDLILASASPRRAAILKKQGIPFKVLPPPRDDASRPRPNVSPVDFAKYLSLQKAQAVAQALDDGVVLAGDTVAAVGGDIFGKPSDRDDARRILTAISGKAHKVITALTLMDARSGRTMTCHDTTIVIMRPLSDAQITEYLDTGAWQGKAGAYGIQDHGDEFVDRVEGSFTNVVGLGVELLESMLAAWEDGNG